MRARTRAEVWLPDRDAFVVEAMHGGSRAVEGRYLGEGRSLVRLDLDRPITFSTLVTVAAHEGYPGHHAEASAKDDLLVRAGHVELALHLRWSPQALVSEGIAGIAREVVMSDPELGQELQRLARSLGRRLDVEAALRVMRARRLLLPALGNAAVALHRDGEPTSQVRSYLAEVALVPDANLDAAMRWLGDPVRRTEPFTHVEGQRLVAEWLELHGQTHGLARLLTEQQAPGPLRSELAAR
jgi:hypothetical protein